MPHKNRVIRPLRWVMLLLTAALALTTMYCAFPTDPGMPTWDVPMAIPFSEARYGLDSLVSKPAELDSNGSGILVDTSGSLSFLFSDSIPKTTINPQDLTFNPETEESFVVETDTIVVPDQGTRQGGLQLSDYVGGEGTFPIPATQLPAAGDTVEFAGFDSLRLVHVAEGGIDLTFNNQTDVEWSLQVVMKANNTTLVDPVYGDTVKFDNIPAGGSETQTIDLSGEDVYPEVLIEVRGSTPGSGGTFVTVDNTDRLGFDIHLKELRCDIAEAIIPEQDVVGEQYALTLDQEDWITSALIDSGYIYFEVVNQTDVDNFVHLTFPDFVRISDGDTLDFPMTLLANEDSVLQWDLQDYELILQMPASEADPQHIRARTTVTVLGTPVDHGPPFAADEYSQVRAGDTVSVKYYTGALKFREFSGVPKSINLTVDQQSQELDIWGDQADLQEDLVSKLQMQDVHVNVGLANSFNMPVRLVISFQAYNDLAPAPYNYAELIDSVEIGPLVDSFTIDSLETLLNILPDRIDFSVAIRAGRDYFTDNSTWDTWSVAATDSVEGTLSIVSPFAVVINDTTPLRPVPTQMAETFDAPIQRVRLVTAVTNTVPINGALFLLAGSFPDSTTAKAELVRANYPQYGVMTPLDVPVPVLNSSGRPVAPAVDTVITEFPPEAFDVFKEENVYVRQVLVLYPTVDRNGDIVPVSMLPDDALTVSVIAEATLRVDGGAEEPTTGQ